MMGLFLSLLLLPTTYAQTSSGEIKGRVYDEEQKEWMTAASVRLLSASDSTLVQGVMTDKQGHFRLSVSTPGSYLVDISFIGYTPYSKAVSVDKSTKVDLGNIKLSPTSTALSELKVVGQSSPVTIKKDTVQFSAGAFKVRPGASVEELLRRIPGIEVDAEGNITYNGESIERVELDGRDFFSSDPTMATKNLPADLIKNVQVVDKKSEQTRLTGMDDGEKTKILNLNVKEELKKGLLGNLKAGYGTKDRYRVDLMGSGFRGDERVTLLANLNNTDGVRRGRGDRKRRSVGANYDNKIGDKLNVTAELSYRENDNTLSSRMTRENLLGNATHTTTDRNISSQGNLSRQGSMNGRLEWTPSDKTALFFMPDISVGRSRSHSLSQYSTEAREGETINSGSSESEEKRSNEGAGGYLHFRHTFNDEGRNIYVRVFGRHESGDSDGTLKSVTSFTKGSRKEILDQLTSSRNESNRGGVSVSYLEPLSKYWSLQGSYSLDGEQRTSDRLAYRADADGEYTILDKRYSRGSSNRYLNHRIGVMARYRPRPMSSISLGVDALPTYTHTITTDGEEVTYDHERSIVNYAPSLMVDLRNDKGLQYMMHYRGSTSQPSMEQLSPVTIQTSPLSQTTGNPDLLPSFRHMIFMRGSMGSREKRQNLQIFGYLSTVNNAIINRRELDRETGISRTTYENVNGVYSFSAGGSLSLPLAKSLTSFTNGRFGGNRGKGYVNGELNTSLSSTVNLSERITWSGEYLQSTVGFSGDYNHLTNTVSRQSDRKTLDYRLFCEATWTPPFGLSLSHRLSYRDARGYHDDVKRNLWIWDLSLGYSFLKDRRGTLELEAVDLLGQRSTFRRTSTAQSITDMLYEGVTSYVMLTFTYKFNSLPTADNSSDHSYRSRYRSQHYHMM